MSERPAFYARPGSVLGDAITLLHPPYTLWHLSYVVIGAALADDPSLSTLGWTLLVFFLGLGVAAHALDELNGRPLGTRFTDRTLVVVAAAALAAASVVVIAGAVRVDGGIVVWAAVGLLFAIGYPLERPALLHTDLGFAVAWGGYPVLTGYWVQTSRLSAAAVLVAVFAVTLSLAQRSLSTSARYVRRRSPRAEVRLEEARWDRETLLETWETPLRWLTWAVVVLGIGMLIARL